jgi:hypothetical protein
LKQRNSKIVRKLNKGREKYRQRNEGNVRRRRRRGMEVRRN